MSEVILFEAVTTPHSALSARGMRWLCGAGLGLALAPALLSVVLGAWPVLGFVGGEVGLMLGMVALHRRWSLRAVEQVLLTEGRLRLRRADGRGRQEMLDLDPYWTRLELEERPGAVPLLVARARGRHMEIGRYLSAEEKRNLHAALGSALNRYRNPVFDNPQLREE